MAIETIMTLIMSGVITFLIAVLLAKINKTDRKNDKRHLENAKREVLLCTHRLDMGDLLLRTAQAVHEGKSNGELSAAISKFEKTHYRYDEFVRVQAGERIANSK